MRIKKFVTQPPATVLHRLIDLWLLGFLAAVEELLVFRSERAVKNLYLGFLEQLNRKFAHRLWKRALPQAQFDFFTYILETNVFRRNAAFEFDDVEELPGQHRV